MAATGSAENGGKLGNRAGLILVSSIAYAAIMSPAPGISKVNQMVGGDSRFIARTKERTAFVLQVGSLLKFLTEFTVDDTRSPTV